MSLRVVARQSFQCMRGSQAYVLGAQLGCGRRHANRAAAGSTTRFQPQRGLLGPVGEAFVASCSTLNRWMNVEYSSPPAYTSGSIPCSHCLVSFSSPQARARMRRAATATSPPTAVGTSPTVPRGAPRSPRVRAQRRNVGPRVFVYLVPIHTTATVSRGRSPEPLPGFGETTKILVLSDRTRVGRGLKLVKCTYGTRLCVACMYGFRV